MQLSIETEVNNHFLNVKESFNESLFLALNPPFPKVELLRFDGCNENDRIEIRLNFLFFHQYWISEIISDELTDQHFVFVDKGIRLPFFLGKWEHEHSIVGISETETVIRDKISFQGPWFIPSFILYPILYLQFLYRKPVYKRLLNRF